VADEKPPSRVAPARKPATPKTPTVAKPTAAARKPAPAKPAPAKPATAKPAVAKPTVAKPTTAKTTAARPAVAKPTVAKPTTAKPAAAKPAAAKPAAAKPTTAKTAAAKPAATKPAATKTATAKTTTTKPATATKTPSAKPPLAKSPAAAAPVAAPAKKPVATPKPVAQKTPSAEPEATPTFSESLAAAVQQSGFSQLKPGETPSARALLGAIGGIRGIVESIVPGIAYLAIYLPTRNLLLAVLIPAFLALVFVVIRAGAKSSMSSAVTGAVLLAITAVLTLITGRAVNNFAPGILINAVFFIVMVVSILIRWPLIGLVVGLLFGDVTGWRADAAKRRILTVATWFWVGLFAIRLAIEIPLFFADNVAALGVVRLITSVPLYAVCLWATWLLVRGVYAGDSGTDTSPTDATAD
jgi:Protein of unknown function (DUF3159)